MRGASGAGGGAVAMSIVTESAVETMLPGEWASSAVAVTRASGSQAGWEARSLAAGSSVVEVVVGAGEGEAVRKEEMDICDFSLVG